MAVNVNPARAIKDCAPIIDSSKQLRGVRRIDSERPTAHVRVAGRGGAAPRLVLSPPNADTITCCRTRFPLDLPNSDALLTMETVACSHKFIPHLSPKTARQ